MKALDIALKDLVSSFRSAFAIIFMFVIPLLVTGMFYFMFGNMGGDGGFDLPVTRVIVANLDKGSEDLNLAASDLPGVGDVNSLGELVVDVLQSEEFSSLLELSLAPDADAARTAVDEQRAGVAVIIPEDFSANFSEVDGRSVLEFYADPTLTIGPGIVHSVLTGFLDSISGAKIAVNVAMQATGTPDPAVVGQVIQRYLAEMAEGDSADTLTVRSLSTDAEPADLLQSILTPIMGGMLIFYAFFTGTSMAQSILREEERLTLQRLFTTPTSQTTIITGKFLSVFLTVFVQVIVLLIAARLLFQVDWGSALGLGLMAAGTILAASAFGIFVNSFLRSTKQGGVVFGGVLTLTGMLAMIPIFTLGSPTSGWWSRTVSLLVPQGWGVLALLQNISGDPISEVALSALGMLVWSIVLFVVGAWRFQKRFA